MATDHDFGNTILSGPELAEGDKVFEDRYELEKMIGQGGMGVVWRAHDTKLNQPVALKFLPDLLRLDHESTFRLKSEAQKGRVLHHTNIVAIYDFLEGGNCAAISMEFVDGLPLAVHKIQDEGQCFDVDKIEKWVDQLCDALSFAHEKNETIHRDIKPANILISKDGQLRILDFGLSRLMTDSVTRLSRETFGGASMGYSSPQQLRGNPPSVEDDIYSLGATIYELLTGQPPFYTGDIYNQTLKEPPKPMMERRKELGVEGKEEIPAIWEETVAACLAKEPEDRPRSVAEVRARLQGETVPIRSRKKPAAKGSGKKKAGLAIAALLVGGIAAAAFFVANQKGDGGDSPGPGPGPDPNPVVVTPGPIEPVVDPKPELGSIRIVSVPSGATVSDGSGEVIGVTPLNLSDIPPGSISYRLSLAGYGDIEVRGTVEENQKAELRGQFKIDKGSIEIVSTPSGASVYDNDGGQLGRTPMVLSNQPTGFATFELRLEGYEDDEVSGSVRASETLSLSRQLKIQTGTVSLTSSPSGAKVKGSSSGSYLGTTPLTIRDVKPGPVSYVLSKDGYGDGWAEGVVAGGRSSDLTATLRRKEEPITPSMPATITPPPPSVPRVQPPAPATTVSPFSKASIERFIVAYDKSGESNDPNTSTQFYANHVSPFFDKSSASKATIQQGRLDYIKKYPVRSYQAKEYRVISSTGNEATIYYETYYQVSNPSTGKSYRGTAKTTMKLRHVGGGALEIFSISQDTD